MSTVGRGGIITGERIDMFTDIVGHRHIILDGESRRNYGHDETGHLTYLPGIVLKPKKFFDPNNILNAGKIFDQRN